MAARAALPDHVPEEGVDLRARYDENGIWIWRALLVSACITSAGLALLRRRGKARSERRAVGLRRPHHDRWPFRRAEHHQGSEEVPRGVGPDFDHPFHRRHLASAGLNRPMSPARKSAITHCRTFLRRLVSSKLDSRLSPQLRSSDGRFRRAKSRHMVWSGAVRYVWDALRDVIGYKSIRTVCDCYRDAGDAK